MIRIRTLAPDNSVLFSIPIEGRAMTELKVNLDFSCAACSQTVSATVTCSGGPISAHSKLLASVAVPCPCCQTVNRILFEPDGTIRDVACHLLSRIPEPSRN